MFYVQHLCNFQVTSLACETRHAWKINPRKSFSSEADDILIINLPSSDTYYNKNTFLTTITKSLIYRAILILQAPTLVEG